MADSKVSDLTVATSTGGSDLLYLVQSNSSKKVTLATLFSNTGNATLQGNTSLGTHTQLLSSPGTIDVTKNITHLSVGASGGTLALPYGRVNQIKVIVMLGSAGGTYTISSNIANNANVSFSNVGHTATLLFTDNNWFVIGGTAVIS